MRKSLILILFVIAYILSSCSKTSALPEYDDVSEQVKYSALNFPSVKFDNIIWRRDGVLVAMQNESVRPFRQPHASEGDKKLRYLDLEQDSNCVVTHYRFPKQLPDGRLGMIKWCATDNTFTDASYMVAYDWQSRQLEQIVQNQLKHFDLAQCFSWNPDMTKGVQRVSDGLTGTLNWLTPVGPEPVHITLRDGNHTWDLAQDYEEDGSREGGRISCPSWSPKGDQIAVFASFDAMGVAGISRLDKQSQLLLLSPETGESESVLSGIYPPESIEWSPDSKKIAFIGYLENELKALFTFDVGSKSLYLIAKEVNFEDLSWSPDSKNIAVIWCDSMECEKSEIRQYTLLK